MIDLTRRNFIKNVGFVGATTLFCGSLLAQNTFTSFSDLNNEEENILAKFPKSTYSDTFISDQMLFECYKKAIVNWEKMGYEASGNFCYSASDNQLKMFPMHLHINGAGKLDAVLLCFGKNTNGEWKTLKSLSGFDLEAITIAMKELKTRNNTVDLTSYLFPSPVQQLNPYGFETKRGSVFLKTQLSYDQTSTKIVVMEGSNILYQKEVISQHSLVVKSVVV
jgi:virulence-associated protein VapD